MVPLSIGGIKMFGSAVYRLGAAALAGIIATSHISFPGIGRLRAERTKLCP